MKIRTTVDVTLTADYTVAPIYQGEKMLTCKGIVCNSEGTVIYVDNVGQSRTLKVGAGAEYIFIDGIKTIKSTANGTTVGAVSILYG